MPYVKRHYRLWQAATVIYHFYMTVFKDVKQTYKEGGFKALRKKYGWKMFAVIISYYLVRDITIYIVIPYFVIKAI